MKGVKLPHKGSVCYALLKALLKGPATIYQAAERADIDIEDRRKWLVVRTAFNDCLQGHATANGILYTINPGARRIIEGPVVREPYVGKVAPPRQLPPPAPVLIVRRQSAGGRQ